jgi:hypothetical protein
MLRTVPGFCLLPATYRKRDRHRTRGGDLGCNLLNSLEFVIDFQYLREKVKSPGIGPFLTTARMASDKIAGSNSSMPRLLAGHAPIMKHLTRWGVAVLFLARIN